MPGNTIGKLFRLTSFGESHGPAVGGVIDGCPAGITLDMELIMNDLLRRRPGRGSSSSRKETDIPRFLSGLIDNTTTGAPIAFVIPNEDPDPADYEGLKEYYRPSHADYTYHRKYGLDDHRLVHRASARETAVRVVAGAIAKQLLARSGIFIAAVCARIGPHATGREFSFEEMEMAASTEMQCPDEKVAAQMKKYLSGLRREGDSSGCEVQAAVAGLPPGIGTPVYHKLESSLAAAMLSINAAVAFEYGSGRLAAGMKGSAYNDAFTIRDGDIRTASNRSGGIQGGISNGEEVRFGVTFRPIPGIAKEQQTVTRKGLPVTISIGGRHDVCAAPRVVPVVEAMGALVLLDQFLLNKATR